MPVLKHWRVALLRALMPVPGFRLAGPTQNPDFDGQNNFFGFLAMVDPTDPVSFFEIVAKAFPGQPRQKDIVFEPRHPD